MGLILLASFVGYLFFSQYISDSPVSAFVTTFPLSTLSFSFGLHWVLSFVSFLIKCCASTGKSATCVHFAWAFLNEIFFVGTILLVWYLAESTGWCQNERNQCVVFFTLDSVILLLFTIPWFQERTDIAMAVFTIFIAASSGLLLWDVNEPWTWGVFKGNWKPFVTISGTVLSLVFTAMCLRKSMSHYEGNLIDLLFAHMTFGLLFMTGSAIGLELKEDWQVFKYMLGSFDWAMTWRYLVLFALFTTFLFSVKSLARFSDSLTTHYTFKLSVLLPIVVYTIKDVLQAEGIHADWKKIIETHPIPTAGIIAFLIAFIYWFVRIFTLGCCFNRKYNIVKRHSVRPYSYE